MLMINECYFCTTSADLRRTAVLHYIMDMGLADKFDFITFGCDPRRFVFSLWNHEARSASAATAMTLSLWLDVR